MLDSRSARRGERSVASRLSFLLFGVLALVGRSALATSVVPLTDRELHARADVVVHGIVVSSDVSVDAQGRPETLTIVEPLEVLKGSLPGSLVLHQLGGELPDGTFFKMWGRPEYVPGREVVVFAIARRSGEYETAEMMLGKFEVQQDEAGNRFAIPDLAAGVHPGVDILPDASPVPDGDGPAGREGRSGRTRGALGRVAGAASISEAASVRPLDGFISSLRSGVFESSSPAEVVGELRAVTHEERVSRGKGPLWGHISNALYRWNNNATAVWTFSGTANTDSGGGPEAQGALNIWTNHPNSSINYTSGAGSTNVIHLNATTSVLGCGWSSCLSGAGVIGCGGPSGAGGGNSWRGDNYSTISGGTVELRAYCNTNEYGSVVTQSVLEHELGHTLGLGHSDQNVSAHDTCRGDEGLATMRSTVQNRTALGTDDEDAVRWLYGDGGTYCAVPAVQSVNANVSFPSAVPTPITWTAVASGGSGPLLYRFLRNDAGTWNVVQDYSSSTTFTWTPSYPEIGTHAIAVWVKTSASAALYDAYMVTPSFSVVSSVNISSLTANRSFPSMKGLPITWTATASGPGTLLYRFYRYDGAGWNIVRDYAASNTYSWTPTYADVGAHAVIVWVKSSSSAAPYDAWTSTATFTISSNFAITAITPNRSFPSPVGTSITWTAAATGPGSLLYRFWRYDGGAWYMVRDWSSSNTFTWTPIYSDVGPHAVIVWVKSTTSVDPYEVWGSTSTFQINSSVQISSLTANASFPLQQGNTVTFTAAASGPPTLLYRFWRKDNNTWVMVQDYAAGNTYAWTPGPSDAGTHGILVWVKSSSSGAPYDSWLPTADFQITP